ncbi:linoleate 13S-lipoxygenase 2-1, chloroplastic-like isoform X6 [Quercus robur]|uniref:linoleate 13S-lipoxygenase 2-1, chloroplastic-like isoform X6 n=1 Tax=Quercus robur TaxID=38942 RepID=UPI002162D100|nr:linoleate 13S-lipoxygenase 2-1, chloroplastic-like isoform X6 [Quercus robur]
MLKPGIQQSQYSSKTCLFLLHKSFIHGNNGSASLPIWSKPSFIKKHINIHTGFIPCNIKAVASTATEKSIKVKAVVTVQPTVRGFLSNLGIQRGLDDIKDLLGKTLLLELVSAELDPETGLEKDTIEGYAHKVGRGDNGVRYETIFEVPIDFGEVGAVLVENEHHREMFLEDIVIDGLPCGPLSVTCRSWVHSKFDSPVKRVFFTNKPYLPSQTPSALRRLREEELRNLRGNGEGERKHFERIYDYDVYNDIGDPDKSLELQRPVFGGEEYPYPRRCRTGRPRCEADELSEKKSSRFYVPRDECFSEIKQLTFSAKTLYSVLKVLVPSLGKTIDKDLGFPYFTAIDSLFTQGVDLVSEENQQGFLEAIMPRLVKSIADKGGAVLHFEIPDTMSRDKFFWFRDEEFARQTLAGLNPYSIQLVTEWPLKSALDPEIYGPPESAITTEMIEEEIGGIMSVDQAIKQKKLFILDYHDLLLQFVSKVRQIEGTTLYGSRALFFLNKDGTLRPLAIELTRPPMDGKPQWKQVFRPSWNSTDVWLWRIAKAHVLAHDSGYHQLVSHWLRTHCVTEPYVIATNRQLSGMHPIYALLHPHFRYTIEINALAREALINAGGIIESAFTPGKYSMEICSAAYALQWRFDQQSLPADLITRGMAVEDPTAPHGLKLAIEDYPFANDGLILWDAIKTWVTDYVNHYYPDPSLVESDQELQAWWTEIRTLGHADKKDEPWWPVLKTPKDLINILTTMVWVTSGHHAAVNFGQYAYGGYFPNRPTIARTNMPTEDPSDKEWETFLKKPERALLQCFPSQLQATRIMAVLDILSNHSPDEEYLGEKIEPSWAEDPVIKAAFEKFHESLKELERIIDERNSNSRFKNRNGAGIVPYELLKPFSQPGVTGKGVPYSISI